MIKFLKEVGVRVAYVLGISVLFAVILTSIQYLFNTPEPVLMPFAVVGGIVLGLVYLKRYGIH